MRVLLSTESTDEIFLVPETQEELDESLKWDELETHPFDALEPTFITLGDTGTDQYRILEKIVTSSLIKELISQGYTLADIGGRQWRPDVSVLDPISLSISIYEVKGPQAGRGGTRLGFAQALDGFIEGYTPYVVLPVQCLHHAQRLRNYYPVGLITYRLEMEEFVFSVQWKGETPPHKE